MCEAFSKLKYHAKTNTVDQYGLPHTLLLKTIILKAYFDYQFKWHLNGTCLEIYQLIPLSLVTYPMCKMGDILPCPLGKFEYLDMR